MSGSHRKVYFITTKIIFLIHVIHYYYPSRTYLEKKNSESYFSFYIILVLCLGTVTRQGINHDFKMSCSKSTNQPSISKCLAFLYNISDLLQPQLQNTVKIIIPEIHALFTSNNCLLTVTLFIIEVNLIKSEK